jgi:hypothetical protein
MGLTEDVNLTEADNTMDKRKGTKGQTIIYHMLHRQLKIDQNESDETTGVNSGRVSSFTKYRLN